MCGYDKAREVEERDYYVVIVTYDGWDYDEDVSSSGEGVVDSGVYSFADDVVCAKEEGNEEGEKKVEKIEVGDEETTEQGDMETTEQSDVETT